MDLCSHTLRKLMRPIGVSFSGSGHLLVYHLGVAKILRQSAWAPNIVTYAGASGGAIAAAVCALLPQNEDLEAFVEESALQCDSFGGLARALGVKLPIAMERGPIPNSRVPPILEEAVRGVSGSLFIGATECRTGRRALFAHFSGSAQLMQCILASATIPRSAHPFDLLKSPSNPPTYPEGEGIVIPSACEWGGMSHDHEAVPYSPYGGVFVDGGLTAAVPTPPPELQLALVTVAPVSGPRGELNSASRAHVHVCPSDGSLKVPFIAPSLAGLRCYLSRDNLVAARHTLGASPNTLRSWFERGQQDAELLLRSHPSWPGT
jgi:predicted acylesterase/phospholipase RssA